MNVPSPPPPSAPPLRLPHVAAARQGAKTQVYAATSPNLENRGGVVLSSLIVCIILLIISLLDPCPPARFARHLAISSLRTQAPRPTQPLR